jgi:hypothetical protein
MIPNRRFAGERLAAQRDYTPHEHEELRALAKRVRQRLQLVTPPSQANGHHPHTSLHRGVDWLPEGTASLQTAPKSKGTAVVSGDNIPNESSR